MNKNKKFVRIIAIVLAGLTVLGVIFMGLSAMM